MRTRVQTTALVVIALAVGLAACACAAEEQAAGEELTATAATHKAAEADPTLEMGVTENARGNVYYYDERRPEAWVTLGTRHGLRPQAVLIFVRHGEIVAEGMVHDVRIADCIVHPAPGTPAGAIIAGDCVRVLVNGPREAMDAKIRRERSQRALGTIVAYALLIGHIRWERN
jgi:hypothetical protein